MIKFIAIKIIKLSFVWQQIFFIKRYFDKLKNIYKWTINFFLKRKLKIGE